MICTCTYVSQIAIINQLHQENHIDKDLAFGNLGDFCGSLLRAVQLFLNRLTILQRCRLARKLQALVKIRQIEFEYEDRVCKVICLAQFFELFG